MDGSTLGRKEINIMAERENEKQGYEGLSIDDAKAAIDELKKEYKLDDEGVAGVLAEMFQAGKLTVTQLEDLIGIVGFELTDEFKNLSPEEQKKDESLFAAAEDEGGEEKKVPEKVVDDAKVTDESGKGEDTESEESEEDKILRLMQGDRVLKEHSSKDEESEKDKILRLMQGN